MSVYACGWYVYCDRMNSTADYNDDINDHGNDDDSDGKNEYHSKSNKNDPQKTRKNK